MTEEEAKNKWCPFTNSEINRDAALDNFSMTKSKNKCNCIGSMCMAWKWSLSPEDIEREANTGSPNWARTAVPKGFCGFVNKE